MLTFFFGLDDGVTEPSVSSLSQGHITVVGTYGECSTLKANKPVMLLLSVTELLGGLCTFIIDRPGRQYTFRGVDASYSIKFVREKNSSVTIYCGNKAVSRAKIANVETKELVYAVETAVSDLSNRYQPDVSSSEEQSIINQWEEDIKLGFDKTLQRWNLNFHPLLC